MSPLTRVFSLVRSVSRLALVLELYWSTRKTADNNRTRAQLAAHALQCAAIASHGTQIGYIIRNARNVGAIQSLLGAYSSGELNCTSIERATCGLNTSFSRACAPWARNALHQRRAQRLMMMALSFAGSYAFVLRAVIVCFRDRLDCRTRPAVADLLCSLSFLPRTVGDTARVLLRGHNTSTSLPLFNQALRSLQAVTDFPGAVCFAPALLLTVCLCLLVLHCFTSNHATHCSTAISNSGAANLRSRANCGIRRLLQSRNGNLCLSRARQHAGLTAHEDQVLPQVYQFINIMVNHYSAMQPSRLITGFNRLVA